MAGNSQERLLRRHVMPDALLATADSPARPRPVRIAPRVVGLRVVALAVALVASLANAACNTTYDVEDRETPVTVVLEAPAAARGEVSVPLLVYVGDQKAVDRVVRFAAGTTTIALPMVYLRAGTPTVSVVIGGRAVASSPVRVSQPTWVVVRIDGQTATIGTSNQDPRGVR